MLTLKLKIYVNILSIIYYIYNIIISYYKYYNYYIKYNNSFSIICSLNSYFKASN